MAKNYAETANMIQSPNNPVSRAIELFEQKTGLGLTVHDLTHELWQYLPKNRFSHSHPRCQAIKNTLAGSMCKSFEINEFRTNAKKWKQGRVHRCHGGFTEIVVPVFHEEKLLLVLFAGPAQTEPGFVHDLVIPHSFPEGKNPDKQKIEQTLPPINSQNLEDIREQLHQTGARLRCILIDQENKPATQVVERKEIILGYVSKNYRAKRSLEGLSKFLCLSPERTRHVVVEETGKTLSRLVKEFRLNAAEALLLNSQKTVEQIAVECGYIDSSIFGKYFKNKHGITPIHWRMKHQG